MNINSFFVLISIGLSMIFFLFEPLNIKKQNFTDIPLFDLDSFTLYELDTKSLITLMNGSSAVKFSDRYEVENIDYTDSSREFIANMKANDGLYKNEFVDLKGDVLYSREDGLVFETQEINYNKKTSVATTDKDFVMFRDSDKVIGTSLVYDNFKGTSKMTNIVAKYNLQERTE